MTLVWLGNPTDPEPSRELVGGKAASIDAMLRLGLPVPPAFALSTRHCAEFQSAGELTHAIKQSLEAGLLRLQEATGRQLGGDDRPLLVSVRSGAAHSMPGMMDTILNLGINESVEARLAKLTGDLDYAADTHRRFIDQFERVVGTPARGTPRDHLDAAVTAVFQSWNSPRAVAYRRHHGIPDDGGTAVTVQSMVFGNLDDTSGTGVLFSRNPLTGDAAPFGEWLPRGQGEDVVSGRHDVFPLERLAGQLPRLHDELLAAASTLEKLAKDVQDIEFTVESGVLWLLQSRAAKRSPDAAVHLAVGLVEDGILQPVDAVSRITDDQIRALLRPRVSPEARAAATVLFRGEPACPGVGSGRVVVSCDGAEDLTDDGVAVVLARPTTDPADMSGMIVSRAIVTEIGGATSHAAVVSRELGTPCVVGTGIGSVTTLAGQDVTVDGSSGEIYAGVLPLAPCGETDNPALARLAAWARELASDSRDLALPELFAAVRATHPAHAGRRARRVEEIGHN